MDDFISALEATTRQTRGRYFGKYRAFVADTADPEARGRLRLTVPSVLGSETSHWALPCTPYGGGSGFGMLMIPPVGAQVLAEFMEGDVSSPLWTGTFWRQGSEVPPESGGKPEVKILKTESGHVFSLDDTENAETVTLLSKAGASVVLDHEGLLILTDSAGATVRLDAAAGELTVQDANGNSLVMGASGITCKDANGNEISTTGGGVTVKAGAVVTIEGSQVAIAGAGGEPLVKGATFLGMFNAHVHTCTAPGAPSSPPMIPLTPAVLTTKSTAQ